ncbi:hypothetical protein ABBQ32_008705 [Trebouxia sp. C0010 RCD-2024]
MIHKDEDKMAEKLAQHEPLLEQLTQYGYEVKYLPIPLGHTGTLYKSDLTALTELGVSKKEATSILKKLHMHAVTCLHNIIKSRRHLKARCTQERTRLNPLSSPPPNIYWLKPKGSLGQP